MKNKALPIVIVVVAVIAGLFSMFGMKVVGENEVAISVTMGNVNGVKTSGVHFEIPFITDYKTILINQQKVKVLTVFQLEICKLSLYISLHNML